MKYIIYILTIFCLLYSSYVEAQVSIMALDEQSDYPSSRTYSEGNNLYSIYAQKNPGFARATLKTSLWNGQFWVHFPDFVSSYMYTETHLKIGITKHLDSLYIAASFINSDSSLSGILKFNGKNWVGIGGLWSTNVIHPEISISDMQSFDNKLFVCGKFNKAGTQTVDNFSYYENGNWSKIESNTGNIRNLQVSNDTMFVCGDFSSIEGNSSLSIAAYTNQQWQTYLSPETNLFGLGLYQNGLIAVGKNTIHHLQNGIWQALNNQYGYECLEFSSIETHNNELYVSGRFKDNFGGTVFLIRWNGSKWESLITEGDITPNQNALFNLNKRNQEFILSGKINKLYGKSISNFAVLHPRKTILKGKLYLDNNENCIFDQGDEGIKNAIVNVNEGQYYLSSNAAGDYELALNPGELYKISAISIGNELHCITNPQAVQTSITDNEIELNFPFKKQQTPSEQHTFISNSGFKVKHGFWGSYSISHIDVNKNYPKIIVLTHDERLEEFLCEFEPEFNSKSEKRWKIYSDTIIQFEFRIDPIHIQMGDDLKFFSSALKHDDLNQTLTTAELDQLVVSAFDPNDKQCHKSEIPSNQVELKYNIHFQNLGTESATDVHVVDTISKTLPLEFIKIIASSHPNAYGVDFKVRDHAIIWSFKNIELQSLSQVGDAKSSGYIQFRSGLEKGLKKGDSISNQAHIYFDYQAPIATNIALTRVVENSIPRPSIQDNTISIFPNPSNGKLSVYLSKKQIQSIEIFDSKGRKIQFEITDYQQDAANIQLLNFSQGIYTIRVSYSTGVVSSKFIVL